jgi:hypothetical protein
MAILLGLHQPLFEEPIVKRTILLLMTVLALVLAACGSDQTDATATPATTPAATATPTEEATPEPTESAAAETPEASDDQTGSVIDGELSDVLPDEIGGLAREEMPPEFEQIMSGAIAQAGPQAEDAEVAWALYGEGQLMVIAMRMPDIAGFEPEQWARMMAAMAPTGPSGQELNAQQVTVGGKDVLQMTPEGPDADGTDAEGTVYVYQTGDALFTVVSQSKDLAWGLLSQLP